MLKAIEFISWLAMILYKVPAYENYIQHLGPRKQSKLEKSCVITVLNFWK